MKRDMPYLAEVMPTSRQYSHIKCEHTVGKEGVDLHFESVIGSRDGQTRASDISAILAEAGGRPVTAYINSPGGNVFEGLAIYNKLNSYKGRVTTVVESSAASIAFIMALAGDWVKAYDNVNLMGHNAWTLTIGNRFAHAEQSQILTKIDEQLSRVISARTGWDQAQAMEWLDGEGKQDGTWLNAEEALELGFIDEIMPSGRPREEKAASAKRLEDFHDRVACQTLLDITARKIQLHDHMLDLGGQTV